MIKTRKTYLSLIMILTGLMIMAYSVWRGCNQTFSPMDEIMAGMGGLGFICWGVALRYHFGRWL